MAEEKKFLDDIGLKHYHDTQVKTHIDNKSNPHGVTASQVGAYTKEEVNSKLSGKANTSDLESLRQSFQDGCDTIVAGCTTYGETPASNSPSDIVGAIGTIYTERYNEGVTATKVGTAVAGNVLAGKTFTNASGVGIAGTMPNLTTSSGITHSSSNSTPVVLGDNPYMETNSDGTKRLGVRYMGSGGYIQANTLLACEADKLGNAAESHVLSGKTFTSSNGVKLIGTMPNNGNITWKPTSSTSASYGKGYYTGITLNSSGAYNAGVSAGKTATNTYTLATQGKWVDENVNGKSIRYSASKGKYLFIGVYAGHHNAQETPSDFTVTGHSSGKNVYSQLNQSGVMRSRVRIAEIIMNSSGTITCSFTTGAAEHHYAFLYLAIVAVT